MTLETEFLLSPEHKTFNSDSEIDLQIFDFHSFDRILLVRLGVSDKMCNFVYRYLPKCRYRNSFF